ncbi:hypothetical protein CK203_066408 [Vitis vinifera]|uniref:Uncharacterized protein n=1 Tax=Vitis vinifera TaxID=29760 RepID=A0A438GBU9_VITVI|nr:hypothetical protein CK203_066408 [Vitis vinifera]
MVLRTSSVVADSIKQSLFHHFSTSLSQPETMKLHTVLDKNNIRGLLCLFRSSPTLHTLILKIILISRLKRQRLILIHIIFPLILGPILISEQEQYWESRSQTFKSFLQHLKDTPIPGTRFGVMRFVTDDGILLGFFER